MKNKFKKFGVVAAMACGAMVVTAPANKAEARWFGTEIECDGNGGARQVTRFFGINIGESTTVPNSAFCQ